MQKRDVVWIALLLLFGMLIGWCIMECGKDEKCILMAGSVAMETFAEAITEVITEGMAEKSGEVGMTVKAEFIGSSAGIEALLKGKAQIAMVSRYLTEEEKSRGVEEHLVAYDGIVIIVNAENTIEKLSKEQICNIFTGKIKNWRELGGENEPIIVIGREYGSGTRDSFEELLGIEGRTKHSNECDSIGVVNVKVGLLRGAIGYVSLEVLGKEASRVKEIAVEGIRPDIESIGKGDYFLVRPFILATYEMGNGQNEAVRKIFELLESKQGGIIFEKAGVVSVAENKDQ